MYEKNSVIERNNVTLTQHNKMWTRKFKVGSIDEHIYE